MSPIWARLFVGFVLLFASPGVAQVTHEVLSIMLDVDCCDGECESGDDARCPGGTCTHCMGAAVATVAAPALPSTGIASHALRPPSRGRVDYDCHASSGYRAPPFRPPVG